jgi:hypothetical protein
VDGLSDDVVRKLTELADRLSSLVEEGQRSGRVSKAAQVLLDGPLDEARINMYRELFGEDPPQ